MSESDTPNERGGPTSLESTAGSAGKAKETSHTRALDLVNPAARKALLDERQQRLRERRRGPALPPDLSAARALAPPQPSDVPPTDTDDADGHE